MIRSGVEVVGSLRWLNVVTKALVAALVTVGLVGPGVAGATPDLRQSPAQPRVVVTKTYDLGDMAFTDSASNTVSELRGVVHYPKRLKGRLPVVVLVHGSWWACTDTRATTWPCDKGRAFPSFRGYDYLGRALARQGLVVVSVSMDAINMTSFDYGDRARLLNRNLAALKHLSRGRGRLVEQLPDLVGRLDMQRVGTMGHSRGGKAVMWQASDHHRDEWPSGVRVRAVLGVAPVKFDEPGRGNRDTLVTRVPVAIVTGGCDGAVAEQGQEYLDDVQGRTHRPAYSVSFPDANHNYYNRRWTPPAHLGEDDSTCAGRELRPGSQRGALTDYATAFYRRFLLDDLGQTPLLLGESCSQGVRSTVRVVRPVRDGREPDTTLGSPASPCSGERAGG